MSKAELNKIYQHYKNRHFYTVLHIALHTETKEDLVIYQDIESKQVFARPKEMFEETIQVEGNDIERFTKTSITA